MLHSIPARLRFVLSWSCLLLATCSSVPRIASAQTAERDAAVRKLVERFFDLYQKRDLDGLMALWSEKSPEFAASKQEFQQIFAANKIQLISLTIRKVNVNDDNSIVSAVAEINAEDVKTGKAAQGFGVINRTFHMLSEGGVWKVWRYVVSEQELAAALISAKTDEERKAMLAAEKELVTVELVRALQSEGIRLNTQGAYSLALDSYALALSLAEQLQDMTEVASALRRIGNVHYSQANYARALEHYRRSLKISEEIGYKEGIAATQMNIGLIFAVQGNYAQALEHFQRSMKISEEMGDKKTIALTLNNSGLTLVSLGNYTQALKHYRRGLKISKEIDFKQLTAAVLHNIGIIHYWQANYAQALEHYHDSLQIRQEIGDKRGIAATLGDIGNIHMAQANYARALECYEKCLEISEELGYKEGVAISSGNIGNIYREQANYARALEHYRRSLKISEEVGDKKEIARMMNSFGVIHYSQCNYAQALEHYQNSLRIRQQIGDKEGIAATLGNIGKVYYSQGNYTQAREEFNNAIAVVEELRGRVAGDEQQQQQFFQMKLAPYHQMIRLLIDEKKSAEGFSYAERAKGRALLDTLGSGRVNLTKAMTDDERAEERRLNAEVVSLNTQIYRENLRKQPDKAVLIDLEARRERARVSYEDFQINLYVAHPELKIQRGGMKPISLREAEKLIPDTGTAIMEYVVTEETTYLFVLTRRQQPQANTETSANAPALNVYTINIKQKDLAERVGRFHTRLTQKDIDFKKFAGQLYDLLIAPARADLKNKTSLIVVPDGVLWQVPFQVLQPSGNHFLIQDYAISYAPSLTVLREMMNVKQKRQPISGALSTLVAFGNPDIDPTTAANLQTIYPEVLADEKLLPLPQTENLVKTLSRLYGPDRSKVYVRAEAREDRAKKEAGACRILQFATHGILDDTNPMYSRLVMSQSGIDEHEDGMLEAWEIMNLDLNAEMVILSACNTARGRVADGEGMIGLAWAFFVAGCPTMVVSQWPVEVNSTTELMIEFHRKLKPSFEGQISGTSKAEALREAVLKLMKNPRYRHPFYWAPFVVIGHAH